MVFKKRDKAVFTWTFGKNPDELNWWLRLYSHIAATACNGLRHSAKPQSEELTPSVETSVHCRRMESRLVPLATKNDSIRPVRNMPGTCINR
eukprot:COSAG06_NODE_7532_length_2469_cov_2.068776_3_plen_92_part_00